MFLIEINPYQYDNLQGDIQAIGLYQISSYNHQARFSGGRGFLDVKLLVFQLSDLLWQFEIISLFGVLDEQVS